MKSVGSDRVIHARLGRWIVVGFIALASAVPANGEWSAWPSPFEGIEVEDVSQTSGAAAAPVLGRGGSSVGQTFAPQQNTLLRMDFRIDNVRDPRPGVVRLFRWRGTQPETVAQDPLYSDVIELAGYGGFRTRSFFPRIAVEPGAMYYVEFIASGRGEYRIRRTAGPVDRYLAGRLFRAGRPGPRKADLWFRSFASSTGRIPPISEAALLAGSSEPSRIASAPRAPWFAPASGDVEITRRDYFERLETFADRFRGGLLSSCRQRLHGNAMREAFLYRASCGAGSCDERRAKHALEFFRKAHAWRFCSPRWKNSLRPCDPACSPDASAEVGFNSLGRPGVAYRWIRDSPSLGERDHALIRELLLDTARRFWPKRENGSHNRAMVAAFGLLLAAHLYPDEPEAPAWRAYAESVWSSFWRYKDTIEDSAYYAGSLWLPAVIEFAGEAGLEDVIWADPSFRELIDRFARAIAPLGVLPNWGDSIGWAPDPSGLVWLFERAAVRTQRPEYRWLAHRLFAYAVSRARDDWPEGDSLYIGHPYLARAYFDAGGPLEARPPLDRREEIFASARVASAAEREVEPGSALGQTFTATASPLVRIDIRARNLGDGRPGRISLWRWQGNRAETVRQVPLFQDRLDLEGVDQLRTLSVWPFLDLVQGETYYFEIERSDAPLILATSAVRPDRDAYTGGRLVEGRASASVADLWFAAFSLTRDGSASTRRSRAGGHELSAERVPDKIVLRSGSDPRDLHAVFNLLSGYQHGQAELGALVSLVDDGSLVLASGPFPYWYKERVRTPQDESVPFMRRYWGGSPGSPGDHVAVRWFSDSRDTTIAFITFLDPGGWQVQQERRLFFVKNRFLLVRDRFTFPSPMAAAVGPIWHAGDVRPERGSHWFDVYNRQPLSNVWRLRNPERYALLYFVPRPGTRASAYQEASYLPPEGCPRDSSPQVSAECRAGPAFVAYQRWTGEAEAGESRWFDTLILPHGPEVAAGTLAEGIDVLFAGQGVALEIQVGREKWLVVDNPAQAPVKASDPATDAGYAVARVSEGQPAYLLTRDATRFEWEGISRTWPVRTSVEIGGKLPPARLSGW